jgi:ParB-like nuclease domain
MLIPITKIQNWDKNPRKISKENFIKLKASLKSDPDFLLVHKPITYLDRESDTYIAIAGNMRVKACKELGYKELECEVMTDVYNEDGSLREDLIKTRAIKHNIEYGEYDQDMLEKHFSSDILMDFQGLDAGLDEFFLEPKNEILDQEEIDENNLPPPPENPIFVLGDLIEVKANGNFYKLICGSALEVDCYQKLVGDQKADLLLTDPPYNVAVQNSQGMKIENDDMSKAEFKQFMSDFYNSVSIFCRKGAVAYIFHSESERVIFTDEFVKAGFKMAQNLIWVKSSSTMSRARLQLEA